jgi:hypothetical protein
MCVGAANGALADSPPGAETGASAVSTSGDAQTSLPQNSFFSSLKQAFNKDFDREVVRGHFEQGSPPNAHRYYCLVDPKTGKRETNGVLGEPVPKPGGMTAIKDSSVSLYRCDDAEKQGLLVTTGYVTGVSARGAIAPAPPAPIVPAPQAQIVPAPQAPIPAGGAALPDASPEKVDVAGVNLGMSPDEVRAVLKSKKLLNYYETSETLGRLDSAKADMPPMTGGRFVNVIATWTSPASSSIGNAVAHDGEAYEVMFTPVPGKERAMAIIHSVGYSAASAVHELSLDSGLVKKYGGFSAPSDVPGSPTWRFQSAGGVQVGDPCNRRAIFGGLGELNVANAARQNLALKTTVDEFRFQLDHCGVAIVTEDHSMANSGAPREQRIVMRFTVTAYSPSIGFEGAATAAKLIQMTADAANKPGAPRTQDPAAPNL